MGHDYFSGPERIDIFEPSGRPMRMGDPAKLAVSNYARVLQALDASDFGRAAEYAALQFESNAAMLTIYVQWPCAYLQSAAEYFGESAAQALAEAAFAHWTEAVHSLATQGAIEQTVVSRAGPLLAPSLLTPGFARAVIETFFSGQLPDYAATAAQMIEEYQARLSIALAQTSIPEAKPAYQAYFSC